MPRIASPPGTRDPELPWYQPPTRGPAVPSESWVDIADVPVVADVDDDVDGVSAGAIEGYHDVDGVLPSGAVVVVAARVVETESVPVVGPAVEAGSVIMVVTVVGAGAVVEDDGDWDELG